MHDIAAHLSICCGGSCLLLRLCHLRLSGCGPGRCLCPGLLQSFHACLWQTPVVCELLMCVKGAQDFRQAICGSNGNSVRWQIKCWQ